MPGVDLLNDILNETLACACNLLLNGLCDEDPSNCDCPCRLFVSAGPPVWDLQPCCSDGALSVHLERIYTFNNFPAASSAASFGCQVPLAAEITVTLLRCFPGLKDDGSAPTAQEIQTASEAIYRDLLLLTEGLICCLQEAGRRRKFVFLGSKIVGPQAGCVGAEIKFSVELLSLL